MKNTVSYAVCTLLAVFLLIVMPGCNKKQGKNSIKITFSGPQGMTMSYRGKEMNGLTRKVVPGTYIFKFSAPGHKTIWKSCFTSA